VGLAEFLDARLTDDCILADEFRDNLSLDETAYALGLTYAIRLRADAAVGRGILTRYRAAADKSCLRGVVEDLAQVYANHPDYDAPWAS
jgi:hypothetical protein